MLRMLTAGESHGPELTVIVDGLPAGLPVDALTIDGMLARRQVGAGSGGRMKIEQDRAIVTAGIWEGQTTGAPVSVRIENKDWKNWEGRQVAPFTVPRPGHVDLAAALAYGYHDLRLGLERASARETAARVAAGALAKALLLHVGIEVGAHVHAIGDVVWEDTEGTDARVLWERAEADPHGVRCPDPATAERMAACIQRARKQRDTVGGIVEVVAIGVPPGLGSHVQADRRLDARLMGAIASVPSVKGVEIGAAFAQTRLPGTAVHDAIGRDATGRLIRPTNRAGGLEGGLSNGEPIVVRAALKPIATTLAPQPSVDLVTGAPTEHRYERSDVCAVPRGCVILEAVVAFVLAQALLERVGGHTLREVQERAESLPRARLQDLAVDDRGVFMHVFARDPGT